MFCASCMAYSTSLLKFAGINTLINIMSRFGKQQETESNITHNERLEFLGDAVVEFLSSIHLFYTFPDLEEGGLATYRAALVQNQHLALLARTLNLDQYMLYAHGSDLCHDLELRHAMANCFEALMGALFLDGGIKVWITKYQVSRKKCDNPVIYSPILLIQRVNCIGWKTLQKSYLFSVLFINVIW